MCTAKMTANESRPGAVPQRGISKRSTARRADIGDIAMVDECCGIVPALRELRKRDPTGGTSGA